jgi:HSP20 family molecular chaperone IbpA
MEDIRSIHLKLLEGRLGGIAYQLSQVRISAFPTQKWSPAVNAFLCHESILILVELAGVDRTEIDLQVRTDRVLLRGRRRSPRPESAEGAPSQVLALEIDEGPFERTLLLPRAVAPDRATAEQKNGILRICLPFLQPA